MIVFKLRLYNLYILRNISFFFLRKIKRMLLYYETNIYICIFEKIYEMYEFLFLNHFKNQYILINLFMSTKNNKFY